MPKDVEIDRRRLLVGAGLSAAAAAATTGARAADNKAPDLSGKSILITGTSSGFGRLGAEHYARLGAKVFATMRNLPRSEAEELKDLAAGDKLDIEVIEIDVTSDEQVANGVAEAEKKAGGKIDVLVNNAGISVAGPIELQDMEATRLMFETNVFGCHRMARAALPAMRAQKSGQIFQVSSQLGRIMIPGYGQYSPTKFALEAMSEQMAYELVPHGVDVTIIQPGGYPTRIWRNANALTNGLFDRADEALLAAYPEIVEALRARDGDGGGTTDPLDVPRAIAEIIAMPPGERPLRRAVHPGRRPQEAINDVSAKTQLAVFGGGAYGPWVKDVHNAD
ncbi:MAG: SDR family oxidoreductase [Pseudomonadota bacterium]